MRGMEVPGSEVAAMTTFAHARRASAALLQTEAPPDLAAIKSRQRAAWAAGDFAVIGTTL
jgi:hypothetical protein